MLNIIRKKMRYDMINKIKQKLNTLLYSDISKKELLDDGDFLLRRFAQHAIPIYLQFDLDKLRKLTLGFIESMHCDPAVFSYKYASSCSKTNLYSSVYAVMILSMYGELDRFSNDQKAEWIEYFNGYQSSDDGLFYDEVLLNGIYNDIDWWGARHLALHMIIAFRALGARPKYPFKFLNKFYDLSYLKKWLDLEAWNGKFAYENDVDNKIMNIGASLQYQRDCWEDGDADKSIRFMQNYLMERINPATGMWGHYNLENKNELSRMAQCAYHLFSLFFYDNIELGYKERIIDHVLKTQNIYGGFGVQLNSSACEDIDSMDILIRMMKQTNYKETEVEMALKRAFIWILANQNEDGGFVFRRHEQFVYGHQEMSSQKNESSMFATWFRTLAVAYLAKHFWGENFNIVRGPGYSF